MFLPVVPDGVSWGTPRVGPGPCRRIRQLPTSVWDRSPRQPLPLPEEGARSWRPHRRAQRRPGSRSAPSTAPRSGRTAPASPRLARSQQDAIEESQRKPGASPTAAATGPLVNKQAEQLPVPPAAPDELDLPDPTLEGHPNSCRTRTDPTLRGSHAANTRCRPCCPKPSSTSCRCGDADDTVVKHDRVDDPRRRPDPPGGHGSADERPGFPLLRWAHPLGAPAHPGRTTPQNRRPAVRT
jgi:hypothetical protein